MNFSNNLKELMIKNNLKNIDLSNQLKINKSNITKYLNGKSQPTLEILEQIKNILNCSYDDLLK